MINQISKSLLLSICVFIFFGSTQTDAMETKPGNSTSSELPVCDRSFFGLSQYVSDDEYYGFLRRFLEGLLVQEELIQSVRERVVVELEIKEIVDQRNEYYKRYLQNLLKNPYLDPVNRGRVKSYLETCDSLQFFSKGTVPIIGTTPLSVATILMHRNYIKSFDFPKGKLHIITRLLKSPDEEVQFLGKHFSYNYQLGAKNDRHDVLSASSAKMLVRFKGFIKSLPDKVCSYFTAGNEQIKLECKITKLGESVVASRFTSDFIMMLDTWTRDQQQKICDSYNKEFFEDLIHKVSTHLDQRTQELLKQLQKQPIENKKPAGKRKSKRRKQKSRRAVVSKVTASSLIKHKYEQEKENIDDSFSSAYFEKEYQQHIDISNFVPCFRLDKKSPKKSIDGYHDGTFCESESSDEIAVIADPCNNMRLYLYACDKENEKQRLYFDYPVKYMDNVNLWFRNTEDALSLKRNDPFLAPKLEDEKECFNAIRIHRFSRHVDRFIDQRGIVQYEPSRRIKGQIDICITIPGHVEFDNDPNPRTCIFVYLFDRRTGLCYHRNIEFKESGDLIFEYLQDGKYKVNLPPEEWAYRKK